VAALAAVLTVSRYAVECQSSNERGACPRDGLGRAASRQVPKCCPGIRPGAWLKGGESWNTIDRAGTGPILPFSPPVPGTRVRR
jgi:hypothetical protein